MKTTKHPNAALPSPEGKSRLSLKTLAIRLAIVWFLAGQMVLVCLPARTTSPLSRLESVYAFQPSSANKAALDNEFERVATFESQRAIGRFAVLLLADVAVIALCWRAGNRQKRQRSSLEVSSTVLAPQTGLN